MKTDSRAARVAAALALGVACGLAGPAHAAKGDSDALLVDTDTSMVVMGGNLRTERSVPRNFIGAGGRVIVEHPVGRNVVVAGGTVEVRAPVGRNLRAAGGIVTIDGPVTGQLTAAAGEVRVGKQAFVGGSARIFAGSVTVDGTITGNLNTSGERVTINGVVNGNVRAAAEEIVLGPGARITGGITYVSGSELKKAEGATILGAVTRQDEAAAGRADEETREIRGAIGRFVSIAGTAMVFLLTLGLGALFIALAPIFSVEASERVKSSPGKSFGIGLLALVGLPLAAALLFVTVIGIPVGVLLMTTYPLALALGFVVGTLWFATYVPVVLRKPPPPTVARAVGYFAIALSVVTVLGMVPVLGTLFVFVLLAVGLGAFLVEVNRRRRSSPPPPRSGAAFARP